MPTWQQPGVARPRVLARISALLVTLSIFIPLTLLIAALRTQPSPKQANLEALGMLIAEGEKIRRDAPAASAKPEQVGQWKQKVREWDRRTKKFLQTQARPQAFARFTSTSGLRDKSYPGVAHDAERDMSLLSHLLQNLTEILEKPEVYF